MLTALIVVSLLYAVYRGYRRGLMMQLLRVAGYVVTFIVATHFYEPISKVAEMFIPFPSVQQNSQLVLYSEAIGFDIDQAFYRVISFVLIGIIGWLVTSFVAMLFSSLEYYELFKYTNRIGGAVLNVCVTYMGLFLFLFILSLIPLEFIQQQFVNSPLAYWIVSQTPILSEWALQTWVQTVPF